MRLDARVRRPFMIVALIATVAAVYWASALEDGAGPRAVVAPVLPRAPAGQPPAMSVGAGDQLDLARLQREPAAQPIEDLFGRPPSAIALPPPPSRKTVDQEAAATPLPPPAPPPLPFKYLGQLAEADRKMVFLSDGDRNLVVATGDVIDNVYRVDEIGNEVLLLTYLPMNVRQTLSTGAAQ